MYNPRDHYFRRAKEERYPARSIYKLEEIDRKYRLIRPGDKVLDLGASPGSWLLYTARRVGPSGLVVGVDVAPLRVALPSQAKFIQQDVFALEVEELQRVCPKFDLLLSDLAPATSGVRLVDTERSLALARRCGELADVVLVPGGRMLVKVFQGEGWEDLRKGWRRSYQREVVVRPKAVRRGSREMYLVYFGRK